MQENESIMFLLRTENTATRDNCSASLNKSHDAERWVMPKSLFKFSIRTSQPLQILIIPYYTPANHRMRNSDQYRMSIRRVSGFALEESKMHTFSRI